MYEGQTLICQSIVEDNWLEYLGFIKKKADEELERQQKRQEALKGLELSQDCPNNTVALKEVACSDYRYYDVSLNSFWNWYINNKV